MLYYNQAKKAAKWQTIEQEQGGHRLYSLDVMSEIVDYNKSEGNAGFGDSKMVVSILQKWYNARIEARVS
jgi:hypothetical protein